ncbi:hypothetical protein KVV02_008448 [Mortierella alpina]|uniref:Ubiquitin-like domain-containing protein n=1 Tax=Mortierella alpina TaxID=64518 RepID=A0A9P8D0R8_MORAP|nr:hypothetical protein KVV02_008448 [Mortierella alpina]
MSSVEESLFISQFLAAFAGQEAKFAADYISPGLAPNWTSKRATFERPAKKTKTEASQGDIQVTIKSLKSGQWTVDVSAQGTIADLKEALQAKAGIDAGSQRLVLKGKALLDNKGLQEYGLTTGSVVHLFAKAGAVISPTTPSSTSPATAVGVAAASSAPESESASTSTSGAGSPNMTSAAAGGQQTAAAPKRPIVTSYRGLSEAGTEIARDAEFWYWLNDQLKERLGSKEDASQMMKGFLGQYRDLIGNAGTKDIEGQIKK